MRWVLVGLLLCVGCANASTQMSRAEYLQGCETLSEFAARIMSVRQLGLPMAEAIKLVRGEAEFEQYVADAYSFPRFGTEEEKARAVSDFKDRKYLKCFNEMPDSIPKK